MSQQGFLVFYRTELVTNPKRLLRDLLQLCRCQGSCTATRSLRAENGWLKFTQRLDDLRAGREEARQIETVSFDDWEPVDFGLDVARAPSQYVEGRCLDIGDLDSPLPVQVGDAIRDGIPENIRGDFDPCSLAIQVGYHDLFECAEHDEGVFIDRSTLSIEFSGYGTAGNCQEFRERVFTLPAVQSVKRHLEQVTGAMKECVFWET